MAEATGDLHNHHNNLKRLCRVCGGNLKKWKEKYKCSYPCIEFKESLAEMHRLNEKKDVCDFHPSKFCNACFLSLTREHTCVDPFSFLGDSHGQLQNMFYAGQGWKTAKNRKGTGRKRVCKTKWHKIV